MWLILFRVFMVALLTQAGYVYSPVPGEPWAGALLGLVASLGIIQLEIRLRTVPAHHLVGGLVGGVIGLFGARLLWNAMGGLDLVAEHFIHSFLIVFLFYMGLVIGTRKGEWFEPARIIAAFKDSAKLHLYKILDTSVIIDGRIADICETGFLEGTLVAPQFVLRELQQVADSSDSLKRNRGRRGLDILAKIQKMNGVHVEIVETDFPDIREVDLKLIELARRMSGKIVTNDFNLNKVAQLRGVPVLNINELANSLKPVVLPGEVLRVFIIKEGKESGQGVAYLDDGTMVVVDQGKKAIGKTIEVTVTSVLQTTAGKMIFCRWAESGASLEDSGRHGRLDRGDRSDRMSRVTNGGSYRRDERFGMGEGPTPAMPRAIEGPASDPGRDLGSGLTPASGLAAAASAAGLAAASGLTPAAGIAPVPAAVATSVPSGVTPSSGITPIPLSVERPHKAD